MATISYGLEIYNAYSTKIYTTTSVTWNQVDMFYVGATDNITKVYPVLDGKEARVIQMLINAPALDRKSTAKTLTLSGTTLNVSGGTEPAYIMILMR